MKKIFTIITALFVGLNLQAQDNVKMVSVGPSYTQQAYYNLEAGEAESISADSWDISFTSFGQTDAGIFINESTPLGGNGLLLYYLEGKTWDDAITASEVENSVILYNAEQNWTDGAFNSLKDDSSPFDFGWGAYNPQTHQIAGNKLFAVVKRDGSVLKLEIQSLSSEGYTFRFANLDGSDEVSAVLPKEEGEDFIYYSFNTQAKVDAPSNDYDLIFQRYTTPLDNGGETLEYTVTGVLLAPGTSAVVADGVDPETVTFDQYEDQLSDYPKTIGHTWKSFSFSTGWELDTDRVQFIKTANDKIYKIAFVDFEGSGTGISTFTQDLVGTVNTEELRKKAIEFSVYPNPTADYVNIDGAENAHIYIIDGSGRQVAEISDYQNESISLLPYASGVYQILVAQRGVVQSTSIIKY